MLGGVLEKSHPDENENDDEEAWENKIANPPRSWAEAIRVTRFVFIFLRGLAGLR